MRTRIFSSILIFFLLVLLFGLGYIQIGRNSRYATMSEENRLKIVPLMAPRGSIFDRNGNVLVKDTLSFNVSVIYSRVDDMNALAEILFPILGTSKEDVIKELKRCRRRPYSPLSIARDVGIEKAIHLEEIVLDHPGLLIEVSAKRDYIYGSVLSNVLGYIGLINRPEFERLKQYGYRVDDLVGRSGIEKYYDDYLRGKHGGKQVEVDFRGRKVTTLGFKEPVRGKDLHLTVDLGLQMYCDSLLKNKRGAIIVMEPDSGKILSMSSAPSYDPGIFIDHKKKAALRSILKDKEYPLINRAISGAYPPGSVFKTVIALGALEEGLATENTTFHCIGSITLGRRTFHCWKKRGHGDQNLKEAIKNSCNVYFWRMGMRLGVDKIAKYSEKLGVGIVTGVDLPGEVKGILPSREWKKKRFKERWYRGETMNYSVGQGYLSMSPLQIARIMSAIANKGDLVKPYVVSRVGDVPINSPEKTDLGISGRSLDIVREGLRKVVNDKRGTGMKARLKNVVVSGKTGTAQTSRGKSHGWFAGFAPYEDPKLTVVVFDEYGGKGGYYAAGTAGKVFKKAKELGLL